MQTEHTHTPSQLDNVATFYQLIEWLWRGGQYGYLWTLSTDGVERLTHWTKTHKRPALPTEYGAHGARHVYFSVHPGHHIPRRVNKHGQPKPTQYVRNSLRDVAAVNCLFAEYDSKDFSDVAAILAHIARLPVQPSVLVNSGGGVHAYWLLDEPYTLSDSTSHTRANRLQSAWVEYVGGDAAAKDLARVLRVPGTHNHKYTPSAPVTVLAADFTHTYSLDTLERHLPAPSSTPVVTYTPRRKTAHGASQPLTATDTQLLEIATRARNGGQLAALLAGSDSQYKSASNADMAAACYLAFYTKDTEQLSRILANSGRGRAKMHTVRYATGETYLERLTSNAIARVGESYTGRQEHKESIVTRRLDDALLFASQLDWRALANGRRHWKTDFVVFLAVLDVMYESYSTTIALDVRTCGERAECSKNTAAAALQRLRRYGLLSIERQSDGKNARVYRLEYSRCKLGTHSSTHAMPRENNVCPNFARGGLRLDVNTLRRYMAHEVFHYRSRVNGTVSRWQRLNRETGELREQACGIGRAGLFVLAALVAAGGQLSEPELAESTGQDIRTVRRCIEGLAALQLVTLGDVVTLLPRWAQMLEQSAWKMSTYGRNARRSAYHALERQRRDKNMSVPYARHCLATRQKWRVQQGRRATVPEKLLLAWAA